MPAERANLSAPHCDAAALAAKAAHADGDATMMSTPNAFSGEAAGRKTRGDAPVTFATAGKAMTRERDTLALTDTVELQGSVAFAVTTASVELQPPAVAAVVDAEERHRHAEQPAVCTADDEQQQPPRQRFVPQSALDAHSSPGDRSAHAPVMKVHVEQPRAAAVALQQ